MSYISQKVIVKFYYRLCHAFTCTRWMSILPLSLHEVEASEAGPRAYPLSWFSLA